MRLLTSAILMAVIALQSSTGHSDKKRQALQLHWEGQQGVLGGIPSLTGNQNLQQQVSAKPVVLTSVSEPATLNSDVNQITTDQLLNQFQQNTNYPFPNFQPQLSQSQLNYNYNPFNPGAYYITNPSPNPVRNDAKAQEQTSGAEVKPVQHSTVVNHGSYNPFEDHSVNPAPLTVQYKRPQNYAPIAPNQPFVLPQAKFVPQERPQYQVQPQQLATPNLYNFVPQAVQKPAPNAYNFQQAQVQKPVTRISNPRYHPLSAILNPYQPQKVLTTPSSTPAPFHARPQSFQTVVQKQKPHATPSRNPHRDNVKNVSEEEKEDTRENDDGEDDDENVSNEEYQYRNEDRDVSDDIDDVDSREYRPTFQAARYIFNRGGESEEEDDEDSSSSNVYPKNTKHYEYDDNPFSKHYGNEHKKYLARYKKSKYYKPKKNKEPNYELEAKPSQNVPVAVRNRKLVEEKWLVTKEQ